MAESDEGKQKQVAGIFSGAAQSAGVGLGKKVEVEAYPDRVLITVEGKEPFVFAIAEDESVFGPETTVAIGKLDDDCIQDLIAKDIIRRACR
jgi:hypothetical protein